MNTYFITAILCVGFAINQLNAQDIKTFKVDNKSDFISFTDNNISKDFKGIIVFDDMVLEKKLASAYTESIKTVAYIIPNRVPDLLTDIDADCKYGILILSSSLKPSLTKYSNNLEKVLLNYKAIFDDVNKEPD